MQNGRCQCQLIFYRCWGMNPDFCSAAGPHFDVLIDMAIADRRQGEVLRWYDAMIAGLKQRGSLSAVWFWRLRRIRSRQR